MTEEHPTRPKTEAVFCDECNAAVRLEKDPTLKLVCACGTERSTKVKQLLPEEWG